MSTKLTTKNCSISTQTLMVRTKNFTQNLLTPDHQRRKNEKVEQSSVRFIRNCLTQGRSKIKLKLLENLVLVGPGFQKYYHKYDIQTIISRLTNKNPDSF